MRQEMLGANILGKAVYREPVQWQTIFSMWFREVFLGMIADACRAVASDKGRFVLSQFGQGVTSLNQQDFETGVLSDPE